MAADGPDNTQPDVQKAVQAGTDLSHGSDQAYDALMREVSTAQQQFGNDTAGFNKYGQAVADGLNKSGTMEEMAEHFAKSDMYNLAHSDGKHIKADDLNPVFGTNALESAFIQSLHDNYGDLQARAGTTWAGNTKDKFDEKDLSKVLASRQHDRDGIEQTRMAAEATAREQAKFSRVTGDLFANDGDPRHSLYSVLDGIKSGDGHLDGKISRSDLRRYQQDYAVRAGRGDMGFNPENLETVRTLDREWDKPLGVALRGTTTRPYGRQGEQTETNWSINLDAAGQAMHTPSDRLFAAYASPGSRPTMARVDGNGDQPTGVAAMPPVEQPVPGANGFDAQGNPLPAGAAPGDTGAGAAPIPRPVNGSGQPIDASAAAAAVPGATGFDAQGNPLAAGAAPGDAGAGAAPIPRPVNGSGQPIDASAAAAAVPGATGFDAQGNPLPAGAAPGDAGAGAAPIPRPVDGSGRPADAPVPGGAAAGARDGSAYDDYYGARPTVADAAPRQPRDPRHAAAAAGGAGDAPPAGAAPRDRTAAPAAGMVADIDHAPPLPEIKINPGDDINKIKADFQQAAIAHFTAQAIYTVKPGQGWDRIARDTMRKSGDDASSEGKVEALSDHIAQLNGWTGRLDKSKMLQPNQQVQVRDADWVKTQVQAAMDNLGKVTDAAKPAGDPGAAATPDPADLFSGSRSGEGDIGGSAAAVGPVKPADAGAATLPKPADASTPPAVPPGGPPPIPKVGADGQPVLPATLPTTADAAPPGAVDANGATQASLDADAARRKALASANSGDAVPNIYGNPLADS